jgi:cell division protein FtsL
VLGREGRQLVGVERLLLAVLMLAVLMLAVLMLAVLMLAVTWGYFQSK